jgi:hypothetical protein
MLIAKTAQLFTPGETGLEKVSANWLLTKDGDATAIRIFERHYSFQRYKDNRLRRQFVGPGQKLVLITADGDSLFVWRKFKSGDNQEGVNCAVFRNEGPVRSKQLILEAEAIAHKRWPGSRFYTYVDPGINRVRDPRLLLHPSRMEEVRDHDMEQIGDPREASEAAQAAPSGVRHR